MLVPTDHPWDWGLVAADNAYRQRRWVNNAAWNPLAALYGAIYYEYWSAMSYGYCGA